jgi:hypothetical protein
MVRDLRSTLLGQRVANVYNLTDKIYTFKFAIPGSSEKVSSIVIFDLSLNSLCLSVSLS